MTYSRLVWILKITLPIFAIALLAAIFLVSRGTSGTGAIPFAKTELDERLRDLRVSEPIYSGTNDAGDDLRLSAQTIVPKDPNTGLTTLSMVNAKIVTANQISYDATSDTATLDRSNDQLDLIGTVHMTNSDGYDFQAAKVTIFNRGTLIQADGPIEGKSKSAQISAGKMEISRETRSGPVQIYFTGGVKLVYDPKS